MSAVQRSAGFDVLRRLARPGSAADRRRARLVALAVAVTGAFLLAGFAILALHGELGEASSMNPDGTFVVVPVQDDQTGLAPYVAQSGLRGGTASGALLLAVPFVLFGVQALRTGTAARERRLAALSLAGATRSQLRRLAVLEGTRAAVTGALLAGPLYLVLWLVLGRAVPEGWRMLPALRPSLLAAWLVLVVVLTAAGALAAALAARPATVSPLGMTRRQPRPLGRAQVVVLLLTLLVCLLGALSLFTTWSDGGVLVLIGGVVASAVAAGPFWVRLVGRRAVRSPDLVTVLAGRRLLADVRSPGRVVAVFFAVGGVLGVVSVLLAESVSESYAADLELLVGIGAASAGAVLALTVAAASQVVGATEQILENRRATATLVALAASPRFVATVVRRQLVLAVAPAAMTGAAAGWAVLGSIYANTGTGMRFGAALIGLAGALAVAGLAATVGARVTTRLVRPAILEASAPENLRVA